MNNKGMTMLYVLAALLIVTFLGSALIKLGHKDTTDSIDYGSMSLSSITAKSSMQAAVNKFEKKSQDAVDFLNDYIDSDVTDTTKLWFLGTPENPISMSKKQNYAVKIQGFDTSTFTIQLLGFGYCNEGRKKVIGIYKLNGIDWELNTLPNPKPVCALHLGNGAGEINAPIHIYGNTYIDNPQATFCDGSHNSHFEGEVKTAPGNTQLTVRGAVFHGPTYFRCPVLHNAVSPHYYAGVGYERDVYISGTNDPVVTGGGMWINGNYSTENTGRIQMNGFQIFGWDDKSYYARSGGPNTLRGISTGEDGTSGELNDSIEYVYDSLGISPAAPPPFNINLDEARTYAIPVSSVASTPDADDFNNKYNSMSSSQLLGEEFLVVEGRGNNYWAAEKGGTFTKKLIWIMENEDPFRVNLSGMFETSQDAVIFLYLNNTGIEQFRNVNRFNGFIYVENTTDTLIFSGEYTSHIYGGVYVKDGIYRREGNSTFHIHYDVDVIDELDAVGVFSDTGTVVVQGDDLILTEPSITTELKGLCF